jgi:hypothetical protein
MTYDPQREIARFAMRNESFARANDFNGLPDCERNRSFRLAKQSFRFLKCCPVGGRNCARPSPAILIRLGASPSRFQTWSPRAPTTAARVSELRTGNGSQMAPQAIEIAQNGLEDPWPPGGPISHFPQPKAQDRSLYHRLLCRQRIRPECGGNLTIV